MEINSKEWRQWRASLGGATRAGGLGFISKDRVCPHCGKEGKGRTMYRWHFDNCKFKGK